MSDLLSPILVVMLTGYVQGMSDLLSPILVVMENEVDAFWCFAGLMERMVSHCFLMCQSFYFVI